MTRSGKPGSKDACPTCRGRRGPPAGSSSAAPPHPVRHGGGPPAYVERRALAHDRRHRRRRRGDVHPRAGRPDDRPGPRVDHHRRVLRPRPGPGRGPGAGPGRRPAGAGHRHRRVHLPGGGDRSAVPVPPAGAQPADRDLHRPPRHRARCRRRAGHVRPPGRPPAPQQLRPGSRDRAARGRRPPQQLVVRAGHRAARRADRLRHDHRRRLPPAQPVERPRPCGDGRGAGSPARVGQAGGASTPGGRSAATWSATC